MDAKNNEYTRLTVDEFNSYVNMLNGQEEDYNLAIQNIKNTNLHITLIKLLGKNIKGRKKQRFLKGFEIINKDCMTFEYLYNEIKVKQDPDMRIIFENTFSKILFEGISGLNKITFIESININIKW